MPDRLETALSAIDAANSDDPNQLWVEGKSEPKELVYARRMTSGSFRLRRASSEDSTAGGAAAAYILPRWQIHALLTAIPQDESATCSGERIYTATTPSRCRPYSPGSGTGHDTATIESVQRLLRKQGIKTDPDMQMLEDVICLVFLEYELADFAERYPAEKSRGHPPEDLEENVATRMPPPALRDCAR